ncbi:hypothetical protein PG985_016413 [Apiospora marii]|uniref:uncharacterized protein n=1 Tax=Apiospora marii TaxID=335849 RepID=UPI00312DAD34
MDNLLAEDPYVNSPDQRRDFFDPETKVPTVIGVSVFLMAFAATSVAARFYTRVRILRMTGLDDWLIMFALTLVMGHGILQCCMTRFNLGRHVGFLTRKDEFTTFMQMFYASLVTYNAALMAIKLAFLAQYYRITAVGGASRRTLIIVSCVIGLWCTSQMVIVIFQCQPISGFWSPTPNTVCVPSFPGLYISAAGNIATDLMIVILPLPMIRRLHLAPAQKAVLSFVFCLGLVTTAISLLRLQYLKVSPDLTWDIADSNLCSLAEISSGIICACLPTLKPLAAQCFPKLFSTLRTQFATLRAPTPEWKLRNLKEALQEEPGSIQGLPLAYLSLESLQLPPLPLGGEIDEEEGRNRGSGGDLEKRRSSSLPPQSQLSLFPPHPAVRRPSSTRTNTTMTTTTTQQSMGERGGRSGGRRKRGSHLQEKENGHTVEIGAAAARSLTLSAFDGGRRSQRISQSSSSIYVKHEITVEVEDSWERWSYYSSTS